MVRGRVSPWTFASGDSKHHTRQLPPHSALVALSALKLGLSDNDPDLGVEKQASGASALCRSFSGCFRSDQLKLDWVLAVRTTRLNDLAVTKFQAS